MRGKRGRLRVRWLLRAVPLLGLLALLVLVAIGRPVGPAARGAMSRWDRVQLRFGRTLAEEALPRCLKDRINRVDALRADIARLEGERGGDRVSGYWQGIDLSALSPMQGRYLSEEGGKWTQGEGLSFSSCGDLPCMLDVIYDRKEGSPGLKAYWWYLRMGYVLSTVAEIPELVQVSTDHRKYLFGPEELDGFMRLSWTLPERMRYLPTLQTFHRLPRLIVPSNWFETQCGDASGFYLGAGYIRLADACLAFRAPDRSDLDLNPFYESVTHEIAHRLDASIGTDSSYFSENEEWGKVSGWWKDKVTNPKTGKSSLQWTVRGWSYDDKWDKAGNLARTLKKRIDRKVDDFLTTYAGTKPTEDFAETFAYFRFHAPKALKDAPRKSEFIRDRFFGGRSFDETGLFAAYEAQALAVFQQGLPEVVDGCIAGRPSSASLSKSAPTLSLGAAVPRPLADCLNGGLHERIGAALEQIRGTEYEACDFFTEQRELTLRRNLFKRVGPEVQALVSGQRSLGPLLRASRALRERLAVELDPREAYLHCRSEAAPESCFSDALVTGFNRVSAPYAADLGAAMETERSSFLRDNTFDHVRSEVQGQFRQLFAGIEASLARAASSRWEACLDTPEPESENAAVLTRPFSGRTQYVSGGILNCINAAAQGDIEGVTGRYLSGVGVSLTEPRAQSLAQELLLPMYVKALDSRLVLAASAEEKLLAERSAGIVDVLVGELVHGLEWLDGVTSRAAAAERCQPAAEQRFDTYAARLSGAQAVPSRFVSRAQQRRGWAAAACQRALAAPAFEQRLKKNASLQQPARQRLEN